nr:MAG TPA: hypothetical protein [Caudoviricetes sp.]
MATLLLSVSLDSVILFHSFLLPSLVKSTPF